MAGVVLIDGVERRRRSRPKILHFGSYHLSRGTSGSQWATSPCASSTILCRNAHETGYYRAH